MSLAMLFDPDTTATMLAAWADKPSVHQLPAGSALPKLINAQTLEDFLSTGCIPPGDVNIIKSAAPRHPASFTSNGGRLGTAQVKHWRELGYTVQMRHLEQWYPPLRMVTEAIQQETGCTSYASAFTTPPGEQGLEWHWDQHLGIIVQLAGTKTWELWAPIVEEPMRDFNTSVQRWADGWVERCKSCGPDLAFELHPGDVLVLPRGWIHNPHSRDAIESSVHLTVVIKERSPMWIAEHLVGSAIHNSAFRRVVPPARISGDALAEQVAQARTLLIDHINALDPATFATVLRGIARSEQDSDVR